uniref:Homeobox domain-containing protein n=1 Tax=Macrostomum lignano TaxID=282301 RepID=A0A1I8HVA4_9PLAT
MDALLSEEMWLPANISWARLYASRPDGRLTPQPVHLTMSLACGLAFCLLRYLVETFLLFPLGRRWGLADAPKDAVRPVTPNKRLDAVFRLNRRPTVDQMSALAGELGWSDKSVANWFRRKRNQLKSSTLRKFVESAWFFLHYSCILVYGFAVLVGKDYFWDARYCWIGWPNQAVDADIYWYYMISLGYYWSAMYYIFTDVKHKDFAEMLIHHVVTVCLMSFSWCLNYVRIGALVLLVHDVVDPFMHLTKCLSYASSNTCLRDMMFVVFMVCWIVTRLTIYPFWVVNSAMFHSWAIVGPYRSWYMFNGCLLVLQVLHVIWFYFILRIALSVVTQDPDAKDSRSDSEMSATEDVLDDRRPGAPQRIGEQTAPDLPPPKPDSMDALLSEEMWLPANISWARLYASRPDGRLTPQPVHLTMSLACGLAFCLLRYLVETFLLFPLGRRWGLADAPKDAVRPVTPNKRLDAIFRLNRRPTVDQMSALAGELGWSDKSVANWFRRKRNQLKSSTLRKFVESAWFFLHYSCILVYGFAVLVGAFGAVLEFESAYCCICLPYPCKDYFWDARYCWIGWPDQAMDADIYWYYMISLGYYWSAMYYIFTDVKHKDFAEMLIHHVVTVCLMSFSWCLNYVRIGALVVLIHDVVDPFMHLTKCLTYASSNTRLRDMMFVVFMVCWIVTRLTIYPFWVVYSAMFHSWAIIGPFRSWYMFNGCLLVLQVLHVIWFYFILRIALSVVTQDPNTKDSRSDSEMSAAEDGQDDKGDSQLKKR